MPRVLIVDDEAGIRFALKRWFERQQWTVVEAHDGARALEAAQESLTDGHEPITLVVCDLHLPGISGEDVVRTWHTTQPALAARVILTTGDAVDEAAHDSVLGRHPHVLQKPFDLTMLRAAVERVVNS